MTVYFLRVVRWLVLPSNGFIRIMVVANERSDIMFHRYSFKIGLCEEREYCPHFETSSHFLNLNTVKLYSITTNISLQVFYTNQQRGINYQSIISLARV